MTNICRVIIGAILWHFAFAVHTFAIEELRLSVQCSNVVLSWPSTAGQNYTVQYRSKLEPSTPWLTLSSSFPAASATNKTTFFHSNIIQYPNCSGSSGGSMAAVVSEGSELDSAIVPISEGTEPMAAPADGSGVAVPLILFPPGFDLSGFLISDPVNSSLQRGTQLSDTVVAMDEPPGPGGGSGSGGTNALTDIGFYRVVRNDVYLCGVTNGMVLSGKVNFPVEFSVATTDQFSGITFYCNGSPLIGASADGCAIQWDTSMTPNGTYSVTVELDFNNDEPVMGTPITVTVSNLVSFPNYFTRFFGNQMWIYAELGVLHADYEIKVYAGETNYLGTFPGHTDDGIISFLWDLTDAEGYTLTDETFHGEFFITPTSGYSAQRMQAAVTSSTAAGKQTWARENIWMNEGDFVVAWCRPDTIPQNADKANTMVASGVVDTLGSVYKLSPGNLQLSDTAFRMRGADSKTSLLSYLADISFRNFYFFGHGSPYSIGGISGDASIGYSEITRKLGNFFVTDKPTNSHPYRFVFIDGCDAGKSAFCEAFGIPAQTVNRSFFYNAGVRSRAFLGFKDTIGFNPAQSAFRATMLSNFYFDWVRRKPLQDCVNNAVNYTLQPMDSSWVIYGATDLIYGLP